MALNYYTLPTNNNKLKFLEYILSTFIEPDLQQGNIYYNMALLNNISPHISQSYCLYYTQLKSQLTAVLQKHDSGVEQPSLLKLVELEKDGCNDANCNTEQKNTRIIGTTFYDMIEIITSLNILQLFTGTQYIKVVHIGNKYADNYQYLSCLRNNPLDKYFYLYETIGHGHDTEYQFHYIFHDLEQGVIGCDINDINIKLYTMQFIKAVLFTLKNQLEGGVCIIKLTHLIHKPILSLVYILLSVYEKSVIIKPTTLNALSHNKYLVCKGFISKYAQEYYTKLYQWLQSILHLIDTTTITNASDLLSPLESLPLYFLNKITDINTILGHKQLEAIDSLTFTLKNKHMRPIMLN